MATATPSKRAADATGYVDSDEFIDYQLRKARGGIHQTDVLIGSVVLALVLFTYLLTFVVLDQWLIPGGFGVTTRLVLLGLVGVFSLAWGIRRIVMPLLRQINVLYAARQIERAFPELKNTLITWVELRNSGKAIPVEIRTAIEKRAAREMAHQDVDDAVDRKLLLRISYGLLTVIALFCGYSLLSPKSVSTSIWRALFPASGVGVATRTEILEVKPGDAEVLARSQLDVTVDLAGVMPQEVQLYFSTVDRRFVNEPLLMRLDEKAPNRFHGLLAGENGRGLMQDLTYYVVAGDARSPQYQLRINQPPSANVLEIAYDYPKYMGLDNSSQPGSTIDAWEGTRVTVSAETNVPVKSATLIMSDTDNIAQRAEEIPLQITDGTRLSATWQLRFRSDGTFARFYHIQVADDRGQVDPQPAVSTIKIRPDKPPEIALIHPTGDMEAPANAIIPLAFLAHDPDFLLRRVTLRFEKQGEALPDIPVLYEGPPDESAVQSTYRLELEKFALQPGDTLTYFLEVEDNMEPFGDRLGNKRRTPKLNIKIIDPAPPEQVQQELTAQEQQIEQQLDPANQMPENGAPQPQERPGDEERPDPMPEDPAMPPNAGENMSQPGDPQQPPMPRNPQQNREGGNAAQPGQPQPNQPQPNQPQPGQEGESQPAQPQPGQEGSGTPKSMTEDPNGEPGAPQPNEGLPQEGTTEGNPGTDMPLGEPQPNSKPQQQGTSSSGENPPNPASENQPSQPARNKPQPNANQPAGNSGEPNSPQPNSPQPNSSQPSGAEKPRGENKAADDEAIRELLNTYGQDDKTPTPQQTPPAESTEKPTGEPMPGQTGEKPTGEPMPGQSGEKPTGEPMPGQTGEKPTGEPMPGQTGEKPTGEPMPGQTGEKPAGEPMPGQTGEKPTGEPMPGQAGEKPTGEPMPGQTGEKPTGEPMPGQTGEKPTGEPMPGQTGEKPTGEPMPGQTGEKPTGEPMPGQTGEKPTGEPMPGQTGEKPTGEPMPGQTGEKPTGEPMPGQSGEKPTGEPMPGQTGEKPTGEPMPGQTGEKPAGEPMPGQTGAKPIGEPMPGQTGEKPTGEPMPGQTGEKPMSPKGKHGDGLRPQQPMNPSGEPSESSGEPGGQPGEQGGKPGEQGDMPPGEQGGKPSESGDMPPGEQGGQPGEPGDMPPGEQGGQPGQQGGEKGGEQPGEQPGEQGGKPGGEGGAAPGGQPGKQGTSGGKDGGPAGVPGGPPQGGTATGGSDPAGGGGVKGGELGAGSGAGNGPAITPDAADLESKRKAANLALKRLKEQLERGETPEELMDKLDFSEQDLQNFMHRLEERLADQGTDESPEAESARRQFDSLLRGTDYQSEGARRDAGNGPQSASESFGAANRPVPPEYRQDSEAYKRKLSKQQNGK